MPSVAGLYQLRAVPSREDEKRIGPVGEEERERTVVDEHERWGSAMILGGLSYGDHL